MTNSPATFPGLPHDKHAPKRAIMLPDESFQSYFLDVFGRPQRISACECERVSEANLAQALHLLNSRRDPEQADAQRRPGRPCWPRTRGPTPRRSRNCSCGPCAQAGTAAQLERVLANIAKNPAAEPTARLRGPHLGPHQLEGIRVDSVMDC